MQPALLGNMNTSGIPESIYTHTLSLTHTHSHTHTHRQINRLIERTYNSYNFAKPP